MEFPDATNLSEHKHNYTKQFLTIRNNF